MEEGLLALLGTGRQGEIAAAYFGFDGRGGASLRVVGNEFGLTYESVRLVASKSGERLHAGRWRVPSFDRALEFIENSLPALAETVELGLQSHGLTTTPFRLEGVVKAAELLRGTVRFSITKVGDIRLVHRKKDAASIDAILRAASRMTSRWGAATVSGIAAGMRGPNSRAPNRTLIVQVPGCRPDFHWLDPSSGWFWFSAQAKSDCRPGDEDGVSGVSPDRR